MAESRTLIRIFLGSPGDLPDERNAAPKIVEAINRELGDLLNFVVQLDKWEITAPASEHPQEYLNRLLVRCDIFVGMLHQKWGMPTSAYSSGFLEEYEVSKKRRDLNGSPEILLFFKDIIVPDWQKNNPHPDVQKVLDFKKRIMEIDKLKFTTFVDSADFGERFRAAITECIIRMQAPLWRGRDNEEQGTPVESGQMLTTAAKENVKNPLSVEGALFAHQFVDRTETMASDDRLSPVDVARFRLLGAIAGTTENDIKALGPHDANLIYRHGKNFDFGRIELLGLRSAGLEHLATENAPIWHWHAKLKSRSLLIASVAWPEDRHASAIQALTVIGVDLNEWPDFARDKILGLWFSETATDEIKVSALNYLAEYGKIEDLSFVDEEISSNSSNTSASATQAKISILLRDSKTEAILSLFALSPSSLPLDLIDRIFHNLDGVDTQALKPGLNQRIAEIRLRTLRVLRSRKALADEELRILLSDDDQWVRFEALNGLLESNNAIADSDARAALIRKSPSYGGLFALGMGGTKIGEEAYTKFELARVAEMTPVELELAVALSSDGNSNFFLALAEKRFKKYGDDIRRSLERGLQAKVAARSTRAEGNALAELFNEGIEETSNTNSVRRQLDILERKSGKNDLHLVRKILDSGAVTYSDSDVSYLKRFGDMDDISRILATINYRPGTLSILAGPDKGKLQLAANALYSVGREHLEGLLKDIGDHSVLPWVISVIPNANFLEISEKFILKALKYTDDRSRKSFALKIVASYPKSRIDGVLSQYFELDTYYYNVVHWLDLGVSLPKKIASPAAEKALARLLK